MPTHELIPLANEHCTCGCEIGSYGYQFEFRGRNYCEGCWINLCSSCLSCDSCNASLGNRGDVYHCGGMFCRVCAAEIMSRCSCCGAYALVEDIRPTDRGPQCPNCYQPEWGPGEWEPDSNSYRQVPRKISFGVELETSLSQNYRSLEGQTEWGCFREASTAGREFVSPILFGDAGLDEIEDFIEENGSQWLVDRNCGTHIHLGVRHLTLQEQRKVAYAFKVSEPVFAKMLPDRIENYMCGRIKWSLADLMRAEDIEDLADASDKFQWLNLRPLLRFGTFEVRLLKGTLDPVLIRNWIRFNARIIKVASKLSWRNLEAWGMDPEGYLREMQGETLDALYETLLTRTRRANPVTPIQELIPPEPQPEPETRRSESIERMGRELRRLLDSNRGSWSPYTAYTAGSADSEVFEVIYNARG